MGTERRSPLTMNDFTQSGIKSMTTPEGSPLKIHELLNLSQVGLDQNNIHFGDVTMQSDNYICVVEGRREEARQVFIDLSKPTKRSDMVYYGGHWDYFIVNLVSRVVARRVGRRLRILKLETKTTRETEIKAHTMEDDVIFWKWINKDTIGVVTDTAVYHWSIEGEPEPVKVFDRECRGQVSDYLADHSLKSLALINVVQDPWGIQLYLLDSKFSLVCRGFLGALTELKLEHNNEPSILFCVVNYSLGDGNYPLHIIEVGEPAEGNRPYREKVACLPSPTRAHVRKGASYHEYLRSLNGDYPYTVRISKKLNIIYVINYPGTIHLYDVESGEWIYTQRLFIGIPRITVSHSDTNGIVVVDEGGRVLSISIDEEKIIHHITTTLKNHELARRLASRWNLTGLDEILAGRSDALSADG